MWRFIKNLFKKKPPRNYISFKYDDDTIVKASRMDNDEWDVTIDTYKDDDLSKTDIIKIMSELKKRIKD